MAIIYNMIENGEHLLKPHLSRRCIQNKLLKIIHQSQTVITVYVLENKIGVIII